MHEIATFAAGCFWGVEEIFRTQPGVLKTRVGYIGGATENPTYQEVCTGQTGHAEAVELTFDPSQTSYETLASLFFKLHDPTTLNRQGPDVGTQYRSAIFVHSNEQKQLAKQAKLNWQKGMVEIAVTQIVEAPVFYAAEDYHQQYFYKRGIAPSCHNLT